MTRIARIMTERERGRGSEPKERGLLREKKKTKKKAALSCLPVVTDSLTIYTST